MIPSDDPFSVRLASGDEDIAAVQRLRYEVFVEELGADTVHADHGRRREADRFDDHAQHLVLEDLRDPGRIVGAYRLIPDRVADQMGGFYSESEYDLSRLKSGGRRLLELGRSVLAPDYRGGTGMHHLWQGLARYVLENKFDILFGVASFHGTDPSPLAQSLSLLHHRFLAPDPLRVRALDAAYQPMNLMPLEAIDRAEAMRMTPALLKAYLRLGGSVGDGAFIDRDFNTTDVCVLMDTGAMTEQARKRFASAMT